MPALLPRFTLHGMNAAWSMVAAVLALNACGGDGVAGQAEPSDASPETEAKSALPTAVTDAASASATTPRDASAQPGDASAQPGDASAQLRDASAQLRDASAQPGDDAIDHYKLDWLDGSVDSGFVTHASIEIDASAERVWQLVRDVNGYGRWCSVLSADAGSVAEGQPIHLEIQLGEPGEAPTPSDETIGVVDDARRAISWSGDFGFEQKTLRFQIVTPSPGGARYTTALRYPPELGSLVIPLLGPNLDRAFQTIAQDLARAATKP
jgi:hypothetical protein